MGLSEWLPFPLTYESLVMYLLILAIAVAGGTAGLMAKHYQNKNMKFGQEDIIYYGLVLSASVIFMITATPAEQVFAYSAGLNGGLGILRNLYDSRTEKNNLAEDVVQGLAPGTTSARKARGSKITR